MAEATVLVCTGPRPWDTNARRGLPLPPALLAITTSLPGFLDRTHGSRPELDQVRRVDDGRASGTWPPWPRSDLPGTLEPPCSLALAPFRRLCAALWKVPSGLASTLDSGSASARGERAAGRTLMAAKASRSDGPERMMRRGGTNQGQLTGLWFRELGTWYLRSAGR